MNKIFYIAEIGINHNGDINIAKKLIKEAKVAGFNAVKFQKRNIDIVYTKEQLESLRESPWGTTFKEQKEGLEFTKEIYQDIDTFCKDIQIEWFEIIYTGIFSAGIGYTLQIIAQSKASPAPAAIILSMESVFGALAAWILMNQFLDLNKILGCLAIFMGVIIVQLIQIKTNKKMYE